MNEEKRTLTIFLAAALAVNILLVALCQIFVVYRTPADITEKQLGARYPQFKKCEILDIQAEEDTMLLLIKDAEKNWHILSFVKMWGLPRYRLVQSNNAWDCADGNNNPIPFRPYTAQVSLGAEQLEIGVDENKQMWYIGGFSASVLELLELYLLACPGLLAVEAALYFLNKKRKA